MGRRRGTFTVVEHQGRAEEVRYLKRDDGRHYKHRLEARNEMLLVESDGRRGVLILPLTAAPLWERED